MDVDKKIIRFVNKRLRALGSHPLNASHVIACARSKTATKVLIGHRKSDGADLSVYAFVPNTELVAWLLTK